MTGRPVSVLWCLGVLVYFLQSLVWRWTEQVVKVGKVGKRANQKNKETKRDKLDQECQAFRRVVGVSFESYLTLSKRWNSRSVRISRTNGRAKVSVTITTQSKVARLVDIIDVVELWKSCEVELGQRSKRILYWRRKIWWYRCFVALYFLFWGFVFFAVRHSSIRRQTVFIPPFNTMLNISRYFTFI